MSEHKVDDRLLDLHSQNFRDLFSKVNSKASESSLNDLAKRVDNMTPLKVFLALMTAILTVFGILFGILVTDINRHKELVASQHIEVINLINRVASKSPCISLNEGEKDGLVLPIN